MPGNNNATKIRKELELKIWLRDKRYNKDLHGIVLKNYDDLPPNVQRRIRKLGLSVIVQNRLPYGSYAKCPKKATEQP